MIKPFIRLKHKGFSLLEIMAVIFIVVLIGSMSIRLFTRRSGVALSTQCKTALQGVIRHAYQASFIERTPQKIIIDLEKKILYCENNKKKPYWTEQFPSFFTTYGTMILSDAMTIEELFIEGKEVLHKAGKDVTTAWFYISKEGICQPVIINALFVEGSNHFTTSFVIHPFGARIEEYATYQKPL